MNKGDEHASIDSEVLEKTGKDESIDIETLEKFLRGELESFSPLSEDCSIYRVPSKLRRLSEGLYSPEVVAIGPIYHGGPEFKIIEEHKRRCLQAFLQRTNVSMKKFLALIRDQEAKLRSCYAENIDLGSKDFVGMILLDAVFIIELFLRLYMGKKLYTGGDRIFTKPDMIYNIIPDLWKLENQIPLFILQDSFELAKSDKLHTSHYEGVSMIVLICEFLELQKNQFLLENNLIEAHFFEAQHFVDLITLCLLPRESKPHENGTRFELKTIAIPSATELHRAGFKFKVESKENLIDISFKDGILVVRHLRLSYNSEALFRNLQVFEMLHCRTGHINDYFIFINYLVNTPKDVEFLIGEGVIDNCLADSGEASAVFHNLSEGVIVSTSKFYYSGIVKDLKFHCKYPWHKWMANLKQNYFNTPWATISVIAAVLLLLLTLVQAVCSILALLSSRSVSVLHVQHKCKIKTHYSILYMCMYNLLNHNPNI